MTTARSPLNLKRMARLALFGLLPLSVAGAMALAPTPSTAAPPKKKKKKKKKKVAVDETGDEADASPGADGEDAAGASGDESPGGDGSSTTDDGEAAGSDDPDGLGGAGASGGPDGPESPDDPGLGGEESTEPSASSQEAPPTIDTAKLVALQDEAATIRDDLFKARARVSSVTSKLYSSALAMELKSNIERFYSVSNFTVTLDGAPVYFAESGLGTSNGPLFDLFAAPGSHVVGISAQLTAKREQNYRVGIDQTFTLIVPENARLQTKLRLHEGGNMFGSFPKRKRGAYVVVTSLQAKTRKNKTKGKGKASGSIKLGTGAPGAPGGSASGAAGTGGSK